MKRIEEYVITARIEEDTYKLFLEREFMIPDGKIFNIYSNDDFFDCVLCWEEGISKKIKECHFVGNYNRNQNILEQLAELILEWHRHHG